MRKIYKIGDRNFWYTEGKQPQDAVDYNPEIKTKVVEPKNKSMSRKKKQEEEK